jgi:hypothetical protein
MLAERLEAPDKVIASQSRAERLRRRSVRDAYLTRRNCARE